MPVYGYARDAQHYETLTKVGIPRKRIVASLNRSRRLQSGDVLVVADARDLGSTWGESLTMVEVLNAKGVRVLIIPSGVDFETESGRVVLGLARQLAQLEGARLYSGMERTHRQRERVGRPGSLTAEQRSQALWMAGGGRSITEIARALGTSRSTVWRVITAARKASPTPPTKPRF